MPPAQPALFDTVSQKDPLNFWANHGLDFKKVTEFLEFDNNELSKLGGVSKRSVRLDDRIPSELKFRLEQIANNFPPSSERGRRNFPPFFRTGLA